MVCIYCPGTTQVTNSRKQRSGKTVWRRRHCQLCDTIFTTIEQPDLTASIRVETSTKELVPFSRDVLFYSIAASCGHRKQSALSDAAALTDTVINLMLAHQKALVTTNMLQETVFATLQRFDIAAATYYQAYFM